MSRLTDNDKKFGPITYAKSDWNPWRLVFSTGGGDEGHPRNHLTIYAFGWVARVNLPTRMQPHRIKHIAQSWDAATVARMGRNWYYETFPREYGFSLNDGFFQLFLGPQTHDSRTTKSWSKFLPWTEWRFYRHTLYDETGNVYWTGTENPRDTAKMRSAWFDGVRTAKEACPSVSFEIEDFDGQRITAKTIIEQREWKFGTGWFKWLSLFRKNMARRSLDINFSDETGPEKGSWKGGTCGTSIDMLPGELHEAAFRRYCEQEHRSKYRRYKVKYLGITTERATSKETQA